MNKTPNISEIREALLANGFELTSESLKQIQKLMKQKEAEEVEKHRAIRKENREKTQSRKDRDARTHKLCNLAGTFEKYFPNIIELYPNELDSIANDTDVATVSGRLGHTNATTTLKIYTHQFKARDIAAASMIGNFVESALNSEKKVLRINEKTA